MHAILTGSHKHQLTARVDSSGTVQDAAAARFADLLELEERGPGHQPPAAQRGQKGDAALDRDQSGRGTGGEDGRGQVDEPYLAAMEPEESQHVLRTAAHHLAGIDPGTAARVLRAIGTDLAVALLVRMALGHSVNLLHSG